MLVSRKIQHAAELGCKTQQLRDLDRNPFAFRAIPAGSRPGSLRIDDPRGSAHSQLACRCQDQLTTARPLSRGILGLNAGITGKAQLPADG